MGTDQHRANRGGSIEVAPICHVAAGQQRPVHLPSHGPRRRGTPVRRIPGCNLVSSNRQWNPTMVPSVAWSLRLAVAGRRRWTHAPVHDSNSTISYFLNEQQQLNYWRPLLRQQFLVIQSSYLTCSAFLKQSTTDLLV
jgi:hypothetical protein